MIRVDYVHSRGTFAGVGGFRLGFEAVNEMSEEQIFRDLVEPMGAHNKNTTCF